MIRSALLCLFYFCSVAIANAQILTIDSIEVQQLDVRASENGMAVLIYNINTQGRKGPMLELLHARGDFSAVSKIETAISKTSKIADAIIGDDGILVMTIDAAQKTNTLTLFSFEGNVLQQKTETIQVMPDNGKTQYYIGNMFGMYYTIVPEADVSGGYRITTYDNELKVVSQKSYTSRRGVMELVSVKKDMDKLYLLRKEILDAKQQKYKYSVQIVMPTMPETASVTDVCDKDGDECMPLNISIKHGVVMVAGMYYKNGKYEEGKAAGIMVCQISQDGQITRNIKVPTSQLNQFLPDALIAELSKDAYLSILDAYDNFGRTVVVGEVLKKELKGKEVKLTISDMLVMHIGQEDMIEKLQFVQRSPSLKINLSGSVNTSNLQNTAEWLWHNKLYNYLFSANVNGKQHLCFYSNDTMQVASTMSVADADSVVGEQTGTFLISRLHDPLKVMSRKLQLNLNANKPETIMRAANKYAYVLPLNDARVLICNYSKLKLQIVADVIRK